MCKQGNELFVGKPDEEVRTCPRKVGNIVAGTDESVREVAVFLLNNRLRMSVSGATEKVVTLTKQTKMGLWLRAARFNFVANLYGFEEVSTKLNSSGIQRA